MPIVSANGVHKKYAFREKGARRQGLGSLIREIVRGEENDVRDQLRETEFWALRDVSVSLNDGDSLGIIGLNGAGKTTLMSVLAGVLKPDFGEVVQTGNVQAVLSLGAGINPKLTGRQNAESGVSLRARSTEEHQSMLANVEEFAELGDFFDSPVGFYSSGMKARLGFAICVSAEPEAILVDEALSVGDASFKQKCLLHLERLKRRGVAMAMVSHSMTSIRQFCDRAIWLHDGAIRAEGTSADIVGEYLKFVESRETNRLSVSMTAKPQHKTEKLADERIESSIQRVEGKTFNPLVDPGRASQISSADRALFITGDDSGWTRPNITPVEVDELYGSYRENKGVEEFAAVLLSEGRSCSQVSVFEALEIEYRFLVRETPSNLNVSLVFHKKGGGRIATISTLNQDLLKGLGGDEAVHCRVKIPNLPLASGEYVVTISIHDGKPYLWRDVILTFQVEQSPMMTWGEYALPYSYEVYTGVAEPELE